MKPTVEQKNRNNGLILFGFATLLLFSLFPGQGQAQLGDYSYQADYRDRRTVSRQAGENLPGNIHLGPLKIHPGVSVDESYTSNLFLEEHNV